MNPKRRRWATLERIGFRAFWDEVRRLRTACANCGALAGHCCRNYRGQRKQTCVGRGWTPPEGEEPFRTVQFTQRELF